MEETRLDHSDGNGNGGGDATSLREGRQFPVLRLDAALCAVQAALSRKAKCLLNVASTNEVGDIIINRRDALVRLEDATSAMVLETPQIERIEHLSRRTSTFRYRLGSGVVDVRRRVGDFHLKLRR